MNNMKHMICNLLFRKSESVPEKKPKEPQAEDAAEESTEVPLRDFVAFWILGLCTEIGYILMICAAFDILHRFDDLQSDAGSEKEEICTTESPGVLLLADIVPSLMMNFICPFLPLAMNIRMAIVISLQTSSFLLVAFATTKWPAVLGVMCTSLALGLGEVTLLSYSSKFNRKVIKAWSSGTGGAGIIGSFSYATLITMGMRPNDTLKMMLVMPVLEAIIFWFFLRSVPKKDVQNSASAAVSTIATIELNHYATTRIRFTSGPQAEEKPLHSLSEKLHFIPTILPFMFPLMATFLLEYTMVSGLFEMIFVKDIWLDHQAQYRWLQFVYQIGVFLARSIGTCVSIQSVWWIAIGQTLNVLYFGFQIGFGHLPNIWIIFCLVFWVGSLGGLAFVHTFWRIATKVPHAHHKFSFGIMTIAESFGIAFGGLAAIPIHKILCRKLISK